MECSIESSNDIIPDWMKSMVILPYPRRMTFGTSTITIPRTLNLKLHNIDPTNSLIVQIQKEIKEELGFSQIFIKDGINEENSQTSELELVNNFEEGYGITISYSGIYLQAYSLHGIFNAFQTLRQIITFVSRSTPTSNNTIILPCLEITDWPDMAIRGFSEDISRGQVPTVESIKHFIKQMSQFKNNFYGLYIEDMFRCTVYPEIGEDRGAFTPEELIEIDQYARSRFVTLFPIFECLGHMDNILMHPSYRELGEFPGAQSFALSNGNMYTFFRNYINELSACFSSKIFHMGCDESFDVGKGKAQDYITTVGKAAALLRHYKKIYEIARDNGNHAIIMYHDVVVKNPSILTQLPKDIIIMYWDYNPRKHYPQIHQIIKAGFQVIVSGAIHCYHRSFLDLEKVFENNLNLIQYAKHLNFKQQIGSLSIEDSTPRIIGQINSTWGAFGHPHLRENDLMGILISGSISWGKIPVKSQKIYEHLGQVFFGMFSIETAANFGSFIRSVSELNRYFQKGYSIYTSRFYSMLFLHPFRMKKFNPFIKKYQQMKEETQCFLTEGEHLEKFITYNKETFTYLLFNLRLLYLLASKIAYANEITQIIESPSGSIRSNQIDKVNSKIDEISQQIRDISIQYEKLWLYCAKKPQLEFHLNRFRQLQTFFEEKKNQIQRKELFINPMLKSAYIWTSERISKPKLRYFRKTFSLNGNVINARIQVIAGNYAEIYVNGEYIGEVLSRMSLSYLPFSQSIKVFDITGSLQTGENLIGVVADHYLESYGSINIYGEISIRNEDQKDSTIYINSDMSWEYHYGPFDAAEWCLPNKKENSSLWTPVKVIGKAPIMNFDLYQPDLLTGEQSYPQELFGFVPNSYFFIQNFLPIWLSKIVRYFILKLFK